MQAHLCISAGTDPAVFTGSSHYPLSWKALTAYWKEALHFTLTSDSKDSVMCLENCALKNTQVIKLKGQDEPIGPQQGLVQHHFVLQWTFPFSRLTHLAAWLVQAAAGSPTCNPSTISTALAKYTMLNSLDLKLKCMFKWNLNWGLCETQHLLSFLISSKVKLLLKEVEFSSLHLNLRYLFASFDSHFSPGSLGTKFP